MNIPAYPAFIPLEKGHKDLFTNAFRDNPPLISEFTFTNLYAWRRVYDLKFSLLDGVLIVRSDEAGRTRFFNPIGRGDPRPVIERITEDFRCVFMRVPPSTADLFRQDGHCTVTEDRDNADYLFRTGELIELSGRKFDGKRNLIRKFKAAHRYGYLKLSLDTIPQVLAFEDRWCVVKNCDDVKGLRDERCAIREILGNYGLFNNLIGGAITVDGAICSVAIAEPLNPDTLVMHVLKADPELSGLYQLMNNEFLMHEAGDFVYVNLEQDLGVEGLRKSKLSYHPVRMIMKYTLTPVPRIRT